MLGGVLHLRGGSPSRGVLHLGGLHPRGALYPRGSPSGGFSILGVLNPRGCSPSGGSPSKGGFSIPGGFSIWGVLHPRGGSPSGGVLHRGGIPCDLSHHAFDVTCMLSPHQLRPTNSAAAYIVVVQGMMGYPPPC